MSETRMPGTRTRPKSKSATLADASGALLRVIAERRREGAVTFVVHSVRDGKRYRNERGATQRHASFEAAVARLAELTREAQKAGWTRRVPRAGFERRPDAFDHIPAPSNPSKEAVA
jgi:hypothetical protein